MEITLYACPATAGRRASAHALHQQRAYVNETATQTTQRETASELTGHEAPVAAHVGVLAAHAGAEEALGVRLAQVRELLPPHRKPSHSFNTPSGSLALRSTSVGDGPCHRAPAMRAQTLQNANSGPESNRKSL
eukprot:3780545-Rhodomonas_salina.1